ncbi:MAG: hypothetical protein SXV54_11840 [Chloroflexota bacterium]|nr:hypothetical protein [Chloroflexota bacterium]
MSERLYAAVMEIDQEEVRRARLFRIIAPFSAIAATLICTLLVVIGLPTPQLSYQYLAPVAVVFVLVTLFSFWLSQQGHLSLAINIYLVSVTVAVFTASYLLNGVNGPLAVSAIAMTGMASFIGGSKTVRWVGLLNSVLYLALTTLEGLGLLQPWEMSGVPLRLIESGTFLAAIVTLVIVTGTFVGLTRHALSVAQQRGQELAEAGQLAEQAAQSEREAREREEKAARQVRQVVQEYTTFLERVTAGDHSARLILDEMEQTDIKFRELLLLGQHLNTTVESLVKALSDLQTTQRRYERDAWESFAEDSATRREFRYQDAKMEPDDKAWLTPMKRAVLDKDVVSSEDVLALPITLRGEVIGTVGVRRKGLNRWSDDDVGLAAAITDQLAQTIESLRLLDETQRRAEQERLTSEITTRMRETLDMDTVLQTAVRDMREALGLHDLTIRLEATDKHPQDAARTFHQQSHSE